MKIFDSFGKLWILILDSFSLFCILLIIWFLNSSDFFWIKVMKDLVKTSHVKLNNRVFRTTGRFSLSRIHLFLRWKSRSRRMLKLYCMYPFRYHIPSQCHNLPATLNIITRDFPKMSTTTKFTKNPKLRVNNIKRNLARSCFQLGPS